MGAAVVAVVSLTVDVHPGGLAGEFGGRRRDAQAEEYKDLITAGIVDPTKVVRTALQDASSVASLLVTTEAMVAERPKKETPMPMPGGGGMGGMDY